MNKRANKNSSKRPLIVGILLCLLLAFMGFSDRMISFFSDHQGIKTPAVSDSKGLVTSSLVQTPCAKEPGIPEWYQRPLCGGNLRMKIPLPQTEMFLAYNSTRCLKGWTLSIDWELQSISATEKVVINPEGKRRVFTQVLGSQEWVFFNRNYDSAVITYESATNNFIVNLDDGRKLYFAPKSSGTGYILARAVDKNGNTFIFDRSNPAITRITEPYGKTAEVYRGSKGEFRGMQGFYGELHTAEFDSQNRMYMLYGGGFAENVWNIAYNNNTVSPAPLPGQPTPTAEEMACIVTEIQSPHDGPDGRMTSIDSYADGTVKAIYQFGEYHFSYTPTTLTAVNGAETIIHTYDSRGVITSSSQNGLTTTYLWDANKNLTRKTAPYGQTSNFRYTNNRIYRFSDSSGRRITYSYHPDGNIREVEGDSTTTSYTWQKLGYLNLLTSRRFGNGETEEYIYNAHGNLKEMRKNQVKVAEYSYDNDANPAGHGLLTRKTDQAGTATFTYDTHGNLDSSTDEYGSVTEYTFAPSGYPEKVVKPNGFEINYGSRYGDFWLEPHSVEVYSTRGSREFVQGLSKTGCVGPNCSDRSHTTTVENRQGKYITTQTVTKTGLGSSAKNIITKTTRSQNFSSDDQVTSGGNQGNDSNCPCADGCNRQENAGGSPAGTRTNVTTYGPGGVTTGGSDGKGGSSSGSSGSGNGEAAQCPVCEFGDPSAKCRGPSGEEIACCDFENNSGCSPKECTIEDAATGVSRFCEVTKTETCFYVRDDENGCPRFCWGH